jgi:hypothetical protein
MSLKRAGLAKVSGILLEFSYRGFAARQGAAFIAVELRQLRGDDVKALFKRPLGSLRRLIPWLAPLVRVVQMRPLFERGKPSLRGGPADPRNARAWIGEERQTRATDAQDVELRLGDPAGALETQRIIGLANNQPRQPVDLFVEARIQSERNIETMAEGVPSGARLAGRRARTRAVLGVTAIGALAR